MNNLLFQHGSSEDYETWIAVRGKKELSVWLNEHVRDTQKCIDFTNRTSSFLSYFFAKYELRLILGFTKEAVIVFGEN
jgi:hypothetical protein